MLDALLKVFIMYFEMSRDDKQNKEIKKSPGDDFLETEYKQMWAYYITTLEERGKIFDIYFKIVAIPFSLVGVIIVSLRLQSGDSSNKCLQIERLQHLIDSVAFGGGIFFLGAGVAGYVCFRYYCQESANSTIYVNATKSIRHELLKRYKIENHGIPDAIFQIAPASGRETRTSIRYSRGLVLATINSAFAYSGAYFIINSIETSRLITASFPVIIVSVFILIHIFTGRVANKNISSPTIARPPDRRAGTGLDAAV